MTEGKGLHGVKTTKDQDCSLKNREPDVPLSWFLDPGGWSKTAVVRLYFIFPGICTLSLPKGPQPLCIEASSYLMEQLRDAKTPAPKHNQQQAEHVNMSPLEPSNPTTAGLNIPT
ncbi:hypothetical protein STEG23_029390 [Scotinomys teguina]